MNSFTKSKFFDRCSPFADPNSDWGGASHTAAICGCIWLEKSVWLRCQTEHRKYLQKGLLLKQNKMSVAQALNGLLIRDNFYVPCEHS